MGELMAFRRKIILSEPYVESVSGGNFKADRSAPLTTLEIAFSPTQEGSGEPSPTNVRPIGGWSGTIIRNGDDAHSVSWGSNAGTVYAGYFDAIIGEIVITHQKIRLDRNTPCEEFRVTSNGVYTNWRYVTGMKPGIHYSDTNVLCDAIAKVGNRADKPNTMLAILFGSSATNNSIYLYNMNTAYGLTQKEQIENWLDIHPIYATIPLNEPQKINIAHNVIRAHRGLNTITADGMEIKSTSFWAH